MPLLMDNVIGIGGVHAGWKIGKRGTEREIQPYGHRDINDYWGHSNPDTALI